MVEIEELIDYIKKGRRNGFRDDALGKRLLNKGLDLNIINEAFSLAGRRKQFDLRYRKRREGDTRTSIAIILEDWLKKELEKKAKKDGLTLNNEVKKRLIESIPASLIPKGIYKNRLIRKKMTYEEKDRHRESVRKSRAKIEKGINIEAIQAVRMRRRQRRQERGEKRGE